MQYSSDEQLVALVKKGDHSAYSCLVKRHTNSLYRLALRTLGNSYDAEDVVQTVLIKFWQKPHKWNVDKSRLSTWLYTVVLNACRDLQRKQSSNSRGILKVFDFESSGERMQQQSEESLLESNQLIYGRRSALLEAISDLPINQRDAINLVVFCELPQSQTAKVLGVSLKAVESLLVRAKRTLSQKVPVQLEKSRQGSIAPLSSLQNKERVNDV